jgi:Zn-finger nucleic acid-binding protein
MKRVPYMRDPHSERVWLDRCADCRGIWFDVGELEQTSGRSLHLVLQATEVAAQCPRCAVPLREASVLSAPALGCPKCRGLHLSHAALGKIDVSLDGEEPTLRPPPFFECVICKKSFSLDQGDGVTCHGCAPKPSLGGGAPSAAYGSVSARISLQALLDFLFTR